MSEHKIGTRPDLGLNVAIFAHLTEYYNQFTRQPAKTGDELLDIAIVAETISKMWKTHQADYDELDKAVADRELELLDTIADLTAQLIPEQPETPIEEAVVVEIKVAETPATSQKPAQTGKKVDEKESK